MEEQPWIVQDMLFKFRCMMSSLASNGSVYLFSFYKDLEKTAGDSDRMKSSRDEMQSAVNMVNFHLRHGNDLLALGQVKGFTVCQVYHRNQL